jgi:hypothetical protein
MGLPEGGRWLFRVSKVREGKGEEGLFRLGSRVGDGSYSTRSEKMQGGLDPAAFSNTIVKPQEEEEEEEEVKRSEYGR